MIYDPNWGDTTVQQGEGLGFTLNANMFSLGGGAASDLFTGIGEGIKAEGNEVEAAQYRQAAQFATLEAALQHGTTQVNTAQAVRQGYQGVGAVKASEAGAGFGPGGSAGDVLRTSASQAALQASMVTQTGQVAELGYKQQASSYNSMAEASELAAKAQKSAQTGSYISTGLKVAAIAAMML